MRRLLTLVVLLAVVIGGVGLWRGWWTVSVDKDKLKQDEQTMTDKAKQVKDDITKQTSGAKPSSQ